MRSSCFKYSALLLVAIVCAYRGFCITPGDTVKTARNSNTLLNAFKNGTVEGRFRNYFMSTINEGTIADYYANAVGGYVRYETKPFHRFQLVAGASFTFNVWSSDLKTPDAATGIANRYEIGLFDITDPGNRFNITRFDELQLRYLYKKGYITLGKQMINTPFINRQDGRMRPTAVDAAWFSYKQHAWLLEGGWIYGISPRSTARWYSVGQSIGLYPQGINVNGGKSNYFLNQKTAGIGLVGVTYHPREAWNFHIWEQFVENMFNTALMQVEYEPDHWIFALQAIRQDAINNGGNADPAKAYITRGSGNWIFGGRVGYKQTSLQTGTSGVYLGYTRIAGKDRFLMPREWGRDPFFTFMPRERNEGNGDVHAITLKYAKQVFKRRLLTDISAGYFRMPDVKNYRLNKYGVPSYGQLNIDLQYTFDKALKGFDAAVLYVYKKRVGNDYGNNRFVINKVNMSLINLVINYRF